MENIHEHNVKSMHWIHNFCVNTFSLIKRFSLSRRVIWTSMRIIQLHLGHAIMNWIMLKDWEAQEYNQTLFQVVLINWGVQLCTFWLYGLGMRTIVNFILNLFYLVIWEIVVILFWTLITRFGVMYICIAFLV